MKLFWVCLISLIFQINGSSRVMPEWNEYIQQLIQLADEYEEGKVETRDTGSVGTNYFNITFTSPPEPITVHSLRPENIDVIAALGDSITAGTGIDAQTIAGIATQYRGLSWTVGGDQELATSLTIPNVLRQFNPQVKGHSVGNKFDFDLIYQDWFNVAVPGGRAHDMTEQTEWLIQRMKDDNRTSFENDWKLISLFIGGNDLCALGSDPDGASPTTYRDEIEKALDLMHTEIPRAMVQIVQIMEIYLLPQVSNGYGAYPLCNISQAIVCGHVVDSVKDETMLQELKELNWEYQKLIEKLIESGKYDTRDDFTVVIQPFFKDTRLPTTEDGRVDATFFAPDCFHFNSKGHALGALNVWNNMFQPVGEKTTVWNITDLSCPTEEKPYIFTRKNSGIPEATTEAAKETTTTVTCVNQVPCKTTPDWAVGLLCALAAVMGLQIFLIIYALKTSKRHNRAVEILTGNDTSL